MEEGVRVSEEFWILMKYISHLYLNINKGMHLRIASMSGQVEESFWLNFRKYCATLNSG